MSSNSDMPDFLKNLPSMAQVRKVVKEETIMEFGVGFVQQDTPDGRRMFILTFDMPVGADSAIRYSFAFDRINATLYSKQLSQALGES